MKIDNVSNEKVILICLIGSGGSSKDINEPIEGSLKLMKEAFLLKKELGEQFRYNFIPYDFGPCSFQIYEDLNNLIKEGIIKEERNNNFSVYSIADSYEKIVASFIVSLDPKIRNSIMNVKKEFNRLSYYSIIAYVYEKYPNWTRASKFRL